MKLSEIQKDILKQKFDKVNLDKVVKYGQELSKRCNELFCPEIFDNENIQNEMNRLSILLEFLREYYRERKRRYV